jgi:hypothetical protein
MLTRILTLILTLAPSAYIRTNAARESFVTLETAAGQRLRVTPEHLLAAGSCAPAAELDFSRAADITRGACVNTVAGRQEIVSVTSTEVC